MARIPHAALRCRYTAFIPLYPLGVVGEMWAVVLALPHIKQRGLRTISMPNAGNFAFDYSLFLMVSPFFLSREKACVERVVSHTE